MQRPAGGAGGERPPVGAEGDRRRQRKPADWPGAIRELEKCIELSPEPSWEASIQDGSGRWRRHYLPYYYLGRAYWGQGLAALPGGVEDLGAKRRWKRRQ